MRPIVLTIAGSDPSGGAGVQADTKAIEANRGYAASAITAITVQNTTGVKRVWPLPADLVGEQIEAVLSDLEVGSVKCGMLAEGAIVAEVARVLARHSAPALVVDPVIRSHHGEDLLQASALGVLRERLFPLARLVTPNVAEAGLLSGVEVASVDDAKRAGARILEFGCEAVLVTGGHLSAERGTDVLIERAGIRVFRGKPIATTHTHGSGCIFASAIATRLAYGDSIAEAVVAARKFIEGALRHGLPIGHGSGPTDPFYFLSDREDDRPTQVETP